jgi:hypothetical protein
VTAVTKPNYSLQEIPGGVWALWTRYSIGSAKTLAVRGDGPAGFTTPVFPLALAPGGLLTVPGRIRRVAIE